MSTLLPDLGREEEAWTPPAQASRPKPAWQDAAWLVVMLLPGVLTALLAFRSGGFYLGTTSLAAAEMAIVVALRFATAGRPLKGIGPVLAVATVAMGAFAAWTLLSAEWSDSFGRALPEYSRALLYGLTMLFFGMLPFDIRRLRWLVYGIAGAIVVICGAALVARLLPEVILDPALLREDRLGYPLSYWNALGIIGCVGTVLCAHIACSTRDAPLARVLAAAAVPLLVVALYYTLSRGGIWAAVAALVLYALLGRPRALLSGVIAMAPATAIALMVASPSSQVTENYPLGMVTVGEEIAVTLAACMLAAAVLRAALLPLDGWLADFRLSESVRRPVLAGATAIGLGLVIVAGMAADAPDVMSNKYHEFTDRAGSGPGRDERRLLSARPEGRFDLWEVALDSYREDRLKGTGAGTYELRWNRDRPTNSKVENAHSLYLEVLAELGLVGLVLLAVVIALILGTFAFRARGPDRALFAALLAAGLAWAVHAGVDWDWQMPAVTLWLFAFGGAAMARSLRRRRRDPYGDAKNTVIRVLGVAACVGLAVLPARAAISQSHLDTSLGALRIGNCQQAVKEARSSLSDVGGRAAPHTIIGYCELQAGRDRRAVEEMRAALSQDPESWELQQNLALARAAAGIDPRPAVRKAVALNPGSRIAQSAAAKLKGASAAEWRAGVRWVAVMTPDIGHP